jgi:hypothetical protein
MFQALSGEPLSRLALKAGEGARVPSKISELLAK